LSTDSGCQDIATELDGGGEYSSISLQCPPVEATYNDITVGDISVLATDNTYAHIPNTKATRFNNTYFHMSNANNQPEPKNVKDPEDSTYNYLGESTSLSSLSRHIEDGQLRSQSINRQSDDTYSHINANTAEYHIQHPKTDYEDTTYNHIGDIPTATKGVPYSKGSNSGQS